MRGLDVLYEARLVIRAHVNETLVGGACFHAPEAVSSIVPLENIHDHILINRFNR